MEFPSRRVTEVSLRRPGPKRCVILKFTSPDFPRREKVVKSFFTRPCQASATRFGHYRWSLRQLNPPGALRFWHAKFIHKAFRGQLTMPRTLYFMPDKTCMLEPGLIPL